MHDELSKIAQFKPEDFPSYHPHITLAYIKPEKTEQYNEKDWFEGIEFEVDSATISRETTF